MSELITEREDLESTIFNEKIMAQLLLFINEFNRYPEEDEMSGFNGFPDIEKENISQAVKMTYYKALTNRFIMKDHITQELFVSEAAKNYLKPYH